MDLLVSNCKARESVLVFSLILVLIVASISASDESSPTAARSNENISDSDQILISNPTLHAAYL